MKGNSLWPSDCHYFLAGYNLWALEQNLWATRIIFTYPMVAQTDMDEIMRTEVREGLLDAGYNLWALEQNLWATRFTFTYPMVAQTDMDEIMRTELREGLLDIICERWRRTCELPGLLLPTAWCMAKTDIDETMRTEVRERVGTIEEGNWQKRRQRSSLLSGGGENLFNSLPR